MDQNNNSQKWLILFWSRGAQKKIILAQGFSKIGKIKSSILFWLSHGPGLEVFGCGGLPVAGRLLKASLAQAGGREGRESKLQIDGLWWAACGSQPRLLKASLAGRGGGRAQ